MTRGTDLKPALGPVDPSTPRRLAASASIVVAVLLGGCLSAGSIAVEGAGATTTGDGGGTLGMSSTSTNSTDASASTSSTDPATTSTSSTGDDTTSTGCSFLCDPTTGGDDLGWCYLYTNDCPRGEKCSLYNDTGGWYNATGCFPVDPDPVPPGAPCTAEGWGFSGIDNCAPGSVCYFDGIDDVGYCLGFCDGNSENPTCSEPGTECYQRVIDGLCLVRCSPLDGGYCYYGGSCVPIPGDGFGCLPDQSGDAGAPGDPCEAHNECDTGNFCVPQDYVGKCLHPMCCTPVCDVDEPESCPFPQSQVCVAWYSDPLDAPPGLADVGVCVVPP